MKLYNIAWDNARSLDERKLGTPQFLSLFWEDLSVVVKDMGTEQVRQMLKAAFGMA